jgi:predicted membrane-bound mannosyltransferase
LLLGTAGAALALWRADNQFAVFAAFWSIGILGAYSIIPYKTPWLTLNIIAPLAVCGGYAAEQAWRQRHIIRHGMAWSVAAALVLSTYQAVALSFFRYDDDSYPYVYAHTSRDVLALVAEVQRLGEHNRDITIAVTSENHFPLSWYLRSYAGGYYGKPVPTNASLVIGSTNQQDELDSLLAASYTKIGWYQLRPGVGLVLYARRDLVGLESSEPGRKAADR